MKTARGPDSLAGRRAESRRAAGTGPVSVDGVSSHICGLVTRLRPDHFYDMHKGGRAQIN